MIRLLSCLISLLFLPFVTLASDQPLPPPPQAELIPRATLFGSPKVAHVRINPQGNHIAYLAPSESGVLNIWVAQSDNLSQATQMTFETDWPIRGFAWTHSPGKMIYAQDNNGDENTQLFLLDIETQTISPLTEAGSISHLAGRLSSDKPETLIYKTNQRDPQFFDLWKYDLNTGEHELIFENNRFNFLICDNDFQLRLAGLTLPSGDMQLFSLSQEQWSPLINVPLESLASFDFLGFSTDNSHFFFVDASSSNTAGLYRYDLARRHRTLIAQETLADITGAYLNPQTFEPEAYGYEYERAHLIPLSPEFNESWQWLIEEIPGDLSIVSRSYDNDMWIVYASYDDRPGDYLLFNRATRGLHYLFNVRPELQDAPLQPMHPVIITAQDGLPLVSYLTVPGHVSLTQDYQASEPSPLMILVHGGPIGIRDSWGLDPETQWLANRGYAVLSINFRGSGGFGKDFIEKSFGQWSRAMHQDLIDGAQWAVDRGIATPDSIGIMGGSYGGYATLVGLSMTPDVFACGIDIVGPSNLATLLESIPEHWKPSIAMLRKKLGLPEQPSEKDQQLLADISPLSYANQISKPLLIMHGANDPRVKQAESEQLVAILRDNKIPFVYALFPDEGHGFVRPENRIASYAISESFLSSVFGLPFEPVGGALKHSSVTIEGVDD